MNNDLFIYIPNMDQDGYDLAKKDKVDEILEFINKNKEAIAFNSNGFIKKNITNLKKSPNGIYILKTALFKFIPNMEQIGNNILKYDLPINNLMEKAIFDYKCVAFTTDGYFKNNVNNLTSKANSGIYVKTRYIRFENEKLDYPISDFYDTKKKNNNFYFNNTLVNGKSPIYNYVNPLSPYFFCNHYISSELKLNYYKSGIREFYSYELQKDKLLKYDHNLIKGNDLLTNKNIRVIRNFDIIQCQVEYLDYFWNEILPLIDDNIKIILITSQQHLPQIERNSFSDKILSNRKILLWISQNPIYINNMKYMSFPYGFSQFTLERLFNFIKNKKIIKTNNIVNLNCSVHPHLPPYHIRNKYPLFGINSGEKLEYEEYLSKIASSKFVLSPSGDRDDCHRHYEAIALDAVPISDINYYEIFGENMIYSNPEEMNKMINNIPYYEPNKDIITLDYWIDQVNKRIEYLKKFI